MRKTENTRFVYACDVHGSVPHYDAILLVAREETSRLVVLGGDLFPNEGDLVREQSEFIAGELFLQEPVIGLVRIERLNDVVAIRPGVRPHVVLLEAIALGEAGTATVQNFAMPGIPAILRRDAKLLALAGWTLELVFPQYGPRRIIREFADYTLREVDLRREADNAETFAANFRDTPEIVLIDSSALKLIRSKPCGVAFGVIFSMHCRAIFMLSCNSRTRSRYRVNTSPSV